MCETSVLSRVLTTYESQYPSTNVISRVEYLVFGSGEYALERSLSVPCFERIIAIGLDQLVRHNWVVVRSEYSIEITKPPAGVIAHRLLLVAAGSGLLYLTLTLAFVLAIRLVVSPLSVICHTPL
nr:hypothetical protein [Halobaculum sp. YSMS11]